MIIGISGYIGSGKDTVGAIIQYLDDKVDIPFSYWYASNAYSGYNQLEKGWQIKKFAGKLKQIAFLLTGIPVEKFEDQEFKKTYLGEEWSVFEPSGPLTNSPFVAGEMKLMSVRTFLQRLGTEGIRTGVHTNAWVNALFADYKPTKFDPKYKDKNIWGLRYPDWIITDCRFPNEAQAIKDKGGVIIRVIRNLPQADYQTLEQKHPSETSLDTWKFDFTINNNGTIDELIGKVKDVMVEV